MLRSVSRALRTAGLAALSALLLVCTAQAANKAYLIQDRADASRAIFTISQAVDDSAAGMLVIREDVNAYTLPVYRAKAGSTVTLEGAEAQLRVFPVALTGADGMVSWTGELLPTIGRMKVTLADGVKTISSSEFKNYASLLTGAYTHETGAGYLLSNAGYYLVSHSSGGLAPSSVIVQIIGANETVTPITNTQPTASSTAAGAIGDPSIFGPGTAANTTGTAAPPQTATAVQNSAPVLLNGQRVVFDAYTIYEGKNGYTYFKLRDLAAALNGTPKQYEIIWDKVTSAVHLISGQSYTLAGGELAAGEPGDKTATLSTTLMYKDGVPAVPTAYVINSNNYFKLRDIGELFNFSVAWDNDAMCIVIDTSLPYTP